VRWITHGSQRWIWQKQKNGEEVLQGNRRMPKGKEKNDINGVRDRFFRFEWLTDIAKWSLASRSGCFVSSRGFWKMIGDRCKVAGWLWWR
jgi:hypothetical protein